MARALTFKINGKEFSAEPTKVERKKLYGWTELVVTDSEGNQCRKVSLNSDGVTIIDQGATKLGMIDDNGAWVTKDELVAVDSKGDKVELVKSSFETGCELDRKVSVDELLTINVTSVYQLEGDDVVALAEAVGRDIFRFDFNYRTDYSADPGYLLAAPAGLFLLVGRPIEIEYIGLEEVGVIEDPDEADFEDDDLDFSMM